jgi:hypothetical protein
MVVERITLVNRTDSQAASGVEIKTEWKTTPQPSGYIFDYLKEKAQPADRKVLRAMFKVFSQSRMYWHRHLTSLHCPPHDPQAAIAQWDGPNLTVWAATQRLWCTGTIAGTIRNR